MERIPAVHRLGNSFSSVTFLVIVLLLSGYASAKASKQGAGISSQLSAPYNEVVKAVRAVAEDGIIRGSWEYKNTTTIDHAQPATESRAFPAWNGPGAVFFKVKKDAIAPQNFIDSEDQGTVTVRYLVTATGDNLTTLRIDAVFQQDNVHRSHPSDGQVEQQELAAVAAVLKLPTAEPTPPAPRIEPPHPDTKLADLQAELDHETAQLQALQSREKELQSQLQLQPRGKRAVIRTSNADLKAEPNNQSPTLQSFSQGDAIIIIQETALWDKVQTQNGEQGWIYRLMLDVAP